MSIAVSDVLAGTALCWRIRRRLPRTAASLLGNLVKTALARLAMLVPVGLVLALADEGRGQVYSLLTVLIAALLGIIAYLGVQRQLRSPQLSELWGVVESPR